MKIRDDNHKTARIIRDHEQRLSDLEETSPSTGSANPLITIRDRLTVGDRIASVVQHDVKATGSWGNPGYRTSSWGSYE